MKPRIAIPVPTTADAAYNRRSWPSYAAAVQASGGEPVEVPLAMSPSALRELLTTCSGICLPGSPADVDPAFYGQQRDPATAPADPARDATDRALLQDAIARGKPVLAICFGLQSLNVWRGGTLVQELSPIPVNHAAGAQVMVAHSAVVEPDSLLAVLLRHDPEGLRLPVNSSHHQAVDQPGDGLRVVARSSEDGIVEAVELDPKASLDRQLFHVEQFGVTSSRATVDKMFHVEQLPFFLGVQWHPERSFESSAASRAIFAALVADARRVAARSSAVEGVLP